MKNLNKSSKEQNFYVWVNPNDSLVRHHIEVTGGFTSGGILLSSKSNLMFLPNPEFQGQITPFQDSVMGKYIPEYNFEISREADFKDYPSRLNAIFLFHSAKEAYKYKECHITHVSDRILKECKTMGDYLFSQHDSSWVDFLRLRHTVSPEDTQKVCKAYWQGIHVEQSALMTHDEPWTQKTIIETLFLGRVVFKNRTLKNNDI